MFVGGLAFATAVGAIAAPKRTETRYRTLDTFAQSLSYVSNQYVEPVEEKKLLYAAARGMLSSLDAYSAFFSPAEYRRLREDTEGEFPGIGLALGPGGSDDAMPDAKGWPIVDDVLPGSPAEKAGIAVDDRIVSVDGRPLKGLAQEAASARVKGPKGTDVVLVSSRDRSAYGDRLTTSPAVGFIAKGDLDGDGLRSLLSSGPD